MTTTTHPEAIARFPFPFPHDRYRYSTNVEPAHRAVKTAAGSWGEHMLDVDSELESELAERERILRADPSRCSVLDHMRPACWDTLLECMAELARAYPDEMALRSDGPRAFVWSNQRLGVEQRFVVGDDDTLPCDPLRYIGSQVQEDLVLLDQREGELWADAGLVTFAADWSLGFDVGMSFLQVHGPVPRVHVEGVIPRAHQFLMRLEAGRPYRRTNWTMTVDRRLDQSTEAYPDWGRDRRLVLGDPAFGERMHLRVEVQHVLRLAGSGAVLFLIRTYLLPLADVATVEPWRARFAEVLADLPPDMVDYKGLTRFRDATLTWLRDAAP